jgi:NAD-dependent DNA ligase
VHNKTDPRVVEKTIIKFFKDLEVEGLGDKNVKKIIVSGANTIEKIINMTIEDLTKVEGFKEKMASKIYNSIKTQVKKASLAQLASASNIFGQGLAEKTIRTILEAQPTILTSSISDEEKIAQISAIKGFANKTAIKFVKAIPEFNNFIEKIRPLQEEDMQEEEQEILKEKEEEDLQEEQEILQEKEDMQKEEVQQKVQAIAKEATKTIQAIETTETHSLKNKVIVLSDFDKSVYKKKDLTNELLKLGARVEASITKETNILVVGDVSKNTTKIAKAKKMD